MDFANFHDEFITKLKIKEDRYYIRLLWKPNDIDLFHIKIYNGEKTWSGSFSNSRAEEYRKNLSHEEYCSKIKMCLEGERSNYFCEFLIQDDVDSATFSWGEDLNSFTKLILGFMSLKGDSESKDSLIDSLMSKNKKLDNANKLSLQRIEELNTDLKKYKSELINLTNVKSSFESNLYGNFLELLNAKKRRIVLLEEKLQMQL